ncbi:hypothetical protein CANCADRAFT_14122, partial [Tortispora caseinolytica NRRL Y-17796]
FVARNAFNSATSIAKTFTFKHQNVALKRMADVNAIDLIMEIRDARAPLSSSNPIFDKMYPSIPRLHVFSKFERSIYSEKQLADLSAKQNAECVVGDLRDDRSHRAIIKRLVNKYNTLDNPYLSYMGMNVMVVGLPNVGKSTVINGLRSRGTNNKGYLRVGNSPGITRKMTGMITISNDPEIYAYDTPGVALPAVLDLETLLILTIVGCISDSSVDPILTADYLLYTMNLQRNNLREKNDNDSWYSKFMKSCTNNISELL